jgi:tRNA threonylcarbamoyladenosine biosynthesis protein TsaE
MPRSEKTRRPKATRSPEPPTDVAGATGTVFSLSERETFDLGRALGLKLSGGEIVVLEGPLGAGKTVFAKGVAAGLGIEPEEVSSPSFTLVHQYEGGRFPVIHVDLYRLEHAEEMATIGLEELLTSGAVVLVEWGERMDAHLRRDAVTVRLDDLGESTRRIDLFGPGTAPQESKRDDA